MEKRWTRKKRAARDAGGPDPKPALSGAVDLTRLVDEAPSPAKSARDDERPPETGLEAEPEQTEPPADVLSEEVPGTPDAAEAPQTAAVLPAAPAPAAEPEVAPQPERETAPEPEPAAPDAEDIASPPNVDRSWAALGRFPIDANKLERNRIVTATREDPVHSAFDVLRTKLLRALRDNGWTRVAVTSPTEGCGKTFMAANLALSLSRQGNCRTVILDLDMRHPTLAKVMNVSNPPAAADFLTGKLPQEDFLRRPARNPHKIGDTIAFGLNGRREDYAAELLQDSRTAAILSDLESALKPDVMLFDMPPALVNDDVLAARPLYDGIILIVGGGMTRPQQIREVERRLGTDTPLLGVVLNKSEDKDATVYGY